MSAIDWRIPPSVTRQLAETPLQWFHGFSQRGLVILLYKFGESSRSWRG